MIRFLSIILLLISFSLSLHAQKNISLKRRFKEASASIKSASNQENIERILLDSLQQLTTTEKIKAEGYHLCALLQHSINGNYNTKAYLKQSLDTIKLYTSILKIYEYSLRSDSFDIDRKFEDKNIKLRKLHRQNLLGGGIFTLKKSRWSDAYSFFDMYLKTSTVDSDSTLSQVAYWATVCGMNENNPIHVLAHLNTAMLSSSVNNKAVLREFEARSYISLGDSLRWLSVLEESVDVYTGYNYFFLNLMDYYVRHGDVERGIAKTDSLLAIDSDRAVYWFAKSMFALSQSDYHSCIQMSDECLSRDSNNVDALYNKGISLLNLALSEKNLTKRKILYRRALEPMQRVRELLPDDVMRWGNPLYRIYLNLNMGEKFDEIDSLLEQQHIAIENQDNTISPSQKFKNAKSASSYKRIGEY